METILISIVEFAQWAWHTIYNFFFLGVLGYLAKKWVAEKLLEKWKNSTPRTLAIWEHYSHNHSNEDVLDCDQERCTVFKQYAS